MTQTPQRTSNDLFKIMSEVFSRTSPEEAARLAKTEEYEGFMSGPPPTIDTPPAPSPMHELSQDLQVTESTSEIGSR